MIHLQKVILEPEQLGEKTVTVVSQPQLASKLGIQPEQTTAVTQVIAPSGRPAFETKEEQRIAQIAYHVIRRLENQPQKLPSVTYLQNPDVQAEVLKEVAAQYRPAQLEIEGVTKPPDLAAVVAKTSEIVVQQTINIPRIQKQRAKWTIPKSWPSAMPLRIGAATRARMRKLTTASIGDTS